MTKLVMIFYKLARHLYCLHIPILPQMIKALIRIFFGCVVSYKTEIGEGSILAYGGLGIVIHERCKIGKNCVIAQNVTLGGTSHKYNVPIIKDNVYIGAGAVILGEVTVGNNVVIGANAVVTKNIPDNCVVAGIPAKIIKENINIGDYK